MTLNTVSPLIIIGMHRSGTSLLSRILESHGLFMGHKKDENNEALFFLDLNRWILKSMGSSWDNPRSTNIFGCDSHIHALICEYIYTKLQSVGSRDYLGRKKYYKYRDICQIDFPWGFKDPRTTYTISIWKKIFPDAKILHIYRHGVDVANSLVQRSTAILKQQEEKFLKKKLSQRQKNITMNFTDTFYCLDLFRALQLWNLYMDEAKKQVKIYGNNSMEIKYEDFLSNPSSIIASVLDFLNLEYDDNYICKYTEDINISRTYAFKKNNSLVEFSKLHKDLLQKHGY